MIKWKKTAQNSNSFNASYYYEKVLKFNGRILILNHTYHADLIDFPLRLNQPRSEMTLVLGLCTYVSLLMVLARVFFPQKRGFLFA
ncbi:hypothetical protein GV64_14315 [Endozoicomonas elysicola]|uniref:Uncharacterized protein n=1 Tax=Endozoicomonas elysicola TaxID=305900 RepID=A0A081KC80_9GAMM|nr:hypothetical protein GV64_14315 [Endozoicomonas elysicola]